MKNRTIRAEILLKDLEGALPEKVASPKATARSTISLSHAHTEHHAEPKTPSTSRTKATSHKPKPLKLDKTPVRKLFMDRTIELELEENKPQDPFKRRLSISKTLQLANGEEYHQAPKETLSVNAVKMRFMNSQKQKNNDIPITEPTLMVSALTMPKVREPALVGKSYSSSKVETPKRRISDSQLPSPSASGSRSRPTSAFAPKSPRAMPVRGKATSAQPREQVHVPAKEEVDTFVREIQHIEQINKRKRRKSISSKVPPIQTQNLEPVDDTETDVITPVSTATGRDFSNEVSQFSSPANMRLVYDNKTPIPPEDEEQGKITLPSLDIIAQEPLKLQYDPSQVKMAPNPLTAAGISSIKDYMMMADACNRAGKHRMEALAHYKLASMYEELHLPLKAIKHYKQFLSISQSLKDEIGMSLALNCLGIVYQKMGPKYAKVALEYHLKHWEIADVQSKIVTHINMGLIFQQLGDSESAAESYTMAHHYAQQVNDKAGESIALANMGLVGKEKGDFTRATVCFNRYLELSENLKDDRSYAEALQQLALLASKQGDNDTAIKNLNKARQIAMMNGDQTKANQIKCNIGIISGNSKAEEYFKELARKYKEGE